VRTLAVLWLALAASAFAADEQLLKLVMPDARVVAGISLAQVKKTPFGQFVLAQFDASRDAGFDTFVQSSGFDPRNNLDEILFASPAAPGRRLVLAKGAFEPARIANLARGSGADVRSFQGLDLISRDRFAVAFLDPATAVAGDAESVRAAIERRTAGPGPGADMAGKIQALSSVSDAWFVSTAPLSDLAQGLPSNRVGGALKGDAFKSIQQASGGIVFASVVKFSGELVARSAEDAAGLAELLRFLAGMANQPHGGQPGVPLDQDFKTEGNLVRMTLRIPEPEMESLIRAAGK
jgi:hypothetical protein